MNSGCTDLCVFNGILHIIFAYTYIHGTVLHNHPVELQLQFDEPSPILFLC